MPEEIQVAIQEFREMLNSLAIDSSHLPNLQTESFTRASFYQDCAALPGLKFIYSTTAADMGWRLAAGPPAREPLRDE